MASSIFPDFKIPPQYSDKTTNHDIKYEIQSCTLCSAGLISKTKYDTFVKPY